MQTMTAEEHRNFAEKVKTINATIGGQLAEAFSEHSFLALRLALRSNRYTIAWHEAHAEKLDREEAALRASQCRAQTACLLAQGQATVGDYRQARQAEDAAHRRA